MSVGAALPRIVERAHQTVAPCDEDGGQPRAKPLVHVGQLRRQVPERAPADAIASALGVQHPIEEAPDLAERVSFDICEARLERALEELADELVENRVSEFFLALEVVVEVPFADPALSQHVIETRALVSMEAHQLRRHGDDSVASIAPLSGPSLRCADWRHAFCTNWLVHLYPTKTIAVNPRRES